MPTYTYVSVDRVTPSSGTVYGGTAVTITGSGFDLATDVTFDGTSLTSIVYVSNTTITGVTATHGSGAVDVVVVGVGTLTAGYTYIIPVDKLPPQPYYSGLQEEQNSPNVSMPWSKWFDSVKQRAENPVLSSSSQVPAESVVGVLAVANIPQLPSSRLTFTDSPRLLGRTSAGSGDSEEISVVGGLVLENGTLSARLVPGGYTVGDIFYADSLNSIAALADVSVGSYLRSGGVATAPLWSTLKLPNAGTVGDVPYVSATNVVSMLPDVAAGSYLRSGGVTTAPVWSTVTIPNAAASGDIWYGSATSVISALAKGSDGQVLWLASGLPAWTATSALSMPYTSITSVPTATVLGRNTAGTGAAEALGTLPSAVQLNITQLGTLTTALAVNNVGPHVIGSATTNTLIQVEQTGTFTATGAGTAAAQRITTTLGAVADRSAFGLFVVPTIIEAGSGTHPILGTARFSPPTITAGAAAVSNAATVYISAAPSAVGAANFALWVEAGDVLFGGDLRIDTFMKLGGATSPGAGNNAIVFADGAAPSSMGSNTSGLYGDDVAGTVHTFAIAEDGTTMQLTGAANNTLATAVQDNITRLGTIATALVLTPKITTYNAVATAGWGVPAIYAEARATAQTTNVTSVAAYTIGAADGSAIVSANVNVTTSTTHNFTVECAYTDETNTPRVLTFTFSQLSGIFVTAITNVTGAGPYEGVPMHIRCKASTSITIRTQAAGTYTSIVFNVEGCIAQVA